MTLPSALNYARMGWPVLPCKADKTPACAHGLKDATTDLDAIRKMWTSDFAVGIRVPSGSIVLDIDRPEAMAEIDVTPESWPGPVSRTPRGGYHLWGKDPRPEKDRGNSTGRLPGGIDVRAGDRGYVIVPPGDGRTWDRAIVPPVDLPALPAGVSARLTTLAGGFVDDLSGSPQPDAEPIPDELKKWSDRLANAPEGEGNTTLNLCAYRLGGLAEHGLSRQQAHAVLSGAAATWQSQMDRGAFERTFSSGWTSGVKSPRKVKPKRAQIVIGTDEMRVNNEAISALSNNDRNVYQRNRELVTVERYDGKTPMPDGMQRKIGQPVLIQLNPSTVRERMANVADWIGINAQGDPVRKHPPAWSVSAVSGRGVWHGIRHLRGISAAPVIDEAGDIHEGPRYSSTTGLWIGNTPEIDVPEHPTTKDAQRAATTLMDLVCDFPFRDDTSRAAWIALLLTPLARPAIDGPTPLFVIEANIRGTGKGLLAEVASMIIHGDSIMAQGYKSNQEEMEKTLVGIARGGESFVLLDNITTAIGGGILDQWLTTTSPSGRTLGASEVIKYDWQTVLCCTVNAAAMKADTDRRSIYCTMESPEEHPELRTGFRYPDIKAHVLEHRGRYLSAALTILRAHAVAGRPSDGGRPKGSYERWCCVVRDALLCAGLPDCERAPDDPLRPVDSDSDDLTALLDALYDYFGDRAFVAADVLTACGDGMGSHEELGDLMAGLNRSKSGRLTGRLIGQILRRYSRRWKNGRCIRKERDSSKNRLQYRIVSR